MLAWHRFSRSWDYKRKNYHLFHWERQCEYAHTGILLWLIVFCGYQRHLVEVMNIKAHGDGAAQIAVDGLDYCPTSRRLVSVAEGVRSVRTWNVANTGQ